MFAKVVGIKCFIKLQDAPIAQIKGEFINWEWDICESGWDNIVCLRKLQDAPIAQIKGGFINWEWYVCESGWDKMFHKITRRADCANKRRIYKLGMRYLRKWVG